MAKNHNPNNDTFAANHAHYISEAQLSWFPKQANESWTEYYDRLGKSERKDFQEIIQSLKKESVSERLELEAKWFTKLSGYKDGNQVLIKLNEAIDTNKRIKEIRFYTVAHEEIDCKVELVTITGSPVNNTSMFTNVQLVLNLLEGKLDLIKIWFVGILIEQDETTMV